MEEQSLPSAELGRLDYLLLQYACDVATPDELAELSDYLQQNRYDDHVREALYKIAGNTPAWENYDRTAADTLIKNILQQPLSITPVRRFNTWKRVAAAASILLVVGSGMYFLFFNKPARQGEIVKTTVTRDVPAPSVNRATITLANGNKVYLDSTNNGTLAKQGDVQLVRLGDGKIQYRQSSGISHQLVYNTLTNPRGSRVIDMILSDGSHVWLNAGSSVTYPVAFIGNERKVSITGEAYFEVAHDATKPFYVTKGDVEIKVLGTHFNVNAYEDEEEVKVTLLEGSVKVKSEIPEVGKSGSNDVIIKPGEQASISEIRDPIRVIRDIHVIRDIDIEQVMAWKSGLFNFNGADLKTVMPQLAHWYDIEVKYEGAVPLIRLQGKMDRGVNLSEVLEILPELGIHYRMEGRALIITK